MDNIVESRAMLTVTHAMSFGTVGGNSIQKSNWFKHPDSVDDYWWQVTSDVENQVATISIMVDKDRNIFCEANSENLETPFIICANECKVYKKALGPGHRMLSKFLVPEATPFNVHRVSLASFAFSYADCKHYIGCYIIIFTLLLTLAGCSDTETS